MPENAAVGSLQSFGNEHTFLSIVFSSLISLVLLILFPCFLRSLGSIRFTLILSSYSFVLLIFPFPPLFPVSSDLAALTKTYLLLMPLFSVSVL